jgi:hypothetical protein
MIVDQKQEIKKDETKQPEKAKYTGSKTTVEASNSAGATVAEKKSSKAWIWVLGGCLGLLIIAGLAIGGCVYFSAHKAGQIIQNVQKEMNNTDFNQILNNSSSNINSSTLD